MVLATVPEYYNIRSGASANKFVFKNDRNTFFSLVQSYTAEGLVLSVIKGF